MYTRIQIIAFKELENKQFVSFFLNLVYQAYILGTLQGKVSMFDITCVLSDQCLIPGFGMIERRFAGIKLYDFFNIIL